MIFIVVAFYLFPFVWAIDLLLTLGYVIFDRSVFGRHGVFWSLNIVFMLVGLFFGHGFLLEVPKEIYMQRRGVTVTAHLPEDFFPRGEFTIYGDFVDSQEDESLEVFYHLQSKEFSRFKLYRNGPTFKKYGFKKVKFKKGSRTYSYESRGRGYDTNEFYITYIN